VEYPGAYCWVQYCSTSSLMTWIIEMCALSVSLQLIQSQVEWLIYQMVVVPVVQRDI